ncbi:P-loop containing nucleoside triphosphate hydrolase protein [Pseudomassariella vexata]|uniref:p-loop containing nucleoside triphosphate hydrolase protein n=1 Tax=Pseudomassariella vexata TaxID=1141098 RepID=A0A1Y2E6L3_9PEZI|nr:P-loop containing nucleoside triphosphate hydrolase protein [Pseudomassariella vexata]ORY67077.1 P-loop containing nucleoside triphosphate hydrolase protein [Pseudomassariella vexata]
MWASKGFANLQKTYDESYLTCSTAVYYESQGDEKEAMRCWKSALDKMTRNGPNKPNYSPRTETERALVESIEKLEIQCKERIDLLEALRLSRQEEPTLRRSSSGEAADSPLGTPSSERGWIGDGTIPALTYPELSKPALPPRPSLSSRKSSEQAVVGRSPGTSSLDSRFPASSARHPPSLPPYGTITPEKASSRSQSPDKRTMRTTLRSGKSEKTLRLSRKPVSKPADRPGASKAATLAWTSHGAKDDADRSSSVGVPTVGRASYDGLSRSSLEQPRRSAAVSQSSWDSHTRRLVKSPENGAFDPSSPDSPGTRPLDEYANPYSSTLAVGAASSALSGLSIHDRRDSISTSNVADRSSRSKSSLTIAQDAARASAVAGAEQSGSGRSSSELPVRRKPADRVVSTPVPNSAKKRIASHRHTPKPSSGSTSEDEEEPISSSSRRRRKSNQKESKQRESPLPADITIQSSTSSLDDEEKAAKTVRDKKKKAILKHLPPGVDDAAAKAIFNEIVVQGDEVHWSDVAGLEIAKNALREAVVYPFLRPDLFMGLREPARGMLLFGPPGTGKTMLARAVATESKSTFFSISASSLTSKYLGESEKLVRALFALAKAMAPSIIFVDEIDSLLSQRSGSGEHEATRRIKTEFLIQWSDLQRAAAGRESPGVGRDLGGDANRVLVLAATNLPWAIDEAARRRFVRRQYIPLPEAETRKIQLETLLGEQKHNLTADDIAELVRLTAGFSGSDITALAKDAAMGPLRSLGDALLHMTMDQIRPIELGDFQASLRNIRPSVSREGLKEYEDWAKQFGERGG